MSDIRTGYVPDREIKVPIDHQVQIALSRAGCEFVAAMANELLRLRRTVQNIPTTADGVTIYHGMNCVTEGDDGEMTDDCGIIGFRDDETFDLRDGDGNEWSMPMSKVWSCWTAAMDGKRASPR